MNLNYLRKSLNTFKFGINYVRSSSKLSSIGAFKCQNEIHIEFPKQSRVRANANFGGNYILVRLMSEKIMKDNLNDILPNLTCWKCGFKFHKLELTCPQCDSIIDDKLLSRLNYFELLEEDTKFDFDKKSLVQRLRKAQSQLHPDKTVQKSERDRQHSEVLSSLMNKAYDTLSDRMLRGLYMLELLGNPLEEGTSEMEPGFLAKVMEINEILSEASGSDLKTMRRNNEDELEKLYNQVSVAFEKSDVNEAKKLLSQIKFYRNINDKIKILFLQFI